MSKKSQQSLCLSKNTTNDILNEIKDIILHTTQRSNSRLLSMYFCLQGGGGEGGYEIEFLKTIQDWVFTIVCLPVVEKCLEKMPE